MDLYLLKSFFFLSIPRDAPFFKHIFSRSFSSQINIERVCV